MERVETNPDWRKNNPTEGIVFQDANGFQWKSKAHGYRIWKIARSAVERIALSRRREIPFDRERYSDTPEIADFIAWAETLPDEALAPEVRSEEHTSELQSLMRISYAVFCLKK